MAENKKKLLDGLKSVIWQVVPGRSQLQNYEKSLLGLVQLTPALAGVRVPVEMLQYVDQGGNPHQYTAEVFEACVRDNQLVKGKVVAVQSLYDALLAELTTQQPEVAAAYRALVDNKPPG
ncbi:mediator complex subunit 10, partial [Haematococcus lacustris]